MAVVRTVRSVPFAAHDGKTEPADIGVVATASASSVAVNGIEKLISDSDGARLEVAPDEADQLANHGVKVGVHALDAGDRLRAIAV